MSALLKVQRRLFPAIRKTRTASLHTKRNQRQRVVPAVVNEEFGEFFEDASDVFEDDEPEVDGSGGRKRRLRRVEAEDENWNRVGPDILRLFVAGMEDRRTAAALALERCKSALTTTVSCVFPGVT
jgi:hypothetical protein